MLGWWLKILKNSACFVRLVELCDCYSIPYNGHYTNASICKLLGMNTYGSILTLIYWKKQTLLLSSRNHAISLDIENIITTTKIFRIPSYLHSRSKYKQIGVQLLIVKKKILRNFSLFYLLLRALFLVGIQPYLFLLNTAYK